MSFLNESILFVADTENHAVRRIDLKENSVSTIAGTGVQGNDRVGGKIGTEQEISSPWDIAGTFFFFFLYLHSVKQHFPL